MKKKAKILLVLFLVFFVALILYAIDPTRAWMQKTILPPFAGIFGGFATTITSSSIWQNYVVPWPNQLIIGAIVLGFPIAFLWHRSFNRIRGRFVRSAARESKMYPVMTEPVSTPAPAPQPTPTKAEPISPEAEMTAEIKKELAVEAEK